jgi:hypothetical protein
MDQDQEPPPLVVTRLIGGLGNQMFQYAAGRALALRCGAALKLDLSGFVAKVPAKRRYALDCFSIHASAASKADLARFYRPPGPRSRRMDRVLQRLHIHWPEGDWPIYREQHFEFDPAVGQLMAPTYLDGYWQSERYFSDIAGVLRRDFTVKAPLNPENEALAAGIDAANAVSLHLRRGDYVEDPTTNRYHGICSLDYYERALACITARAGPPLLFIFSDDQQWARANLRLAVPMTFVDANPPDQGHLDLQLMARCRHHIIANSSFSWWGAWLNPSPDKIVVAPQRWFGGAGHDTRDLIPPNWVQL